METPTIRGLQWCFASGGEVPTGALSVGFDQRSGDFDYVARATIMRGRGTVPGKLVCSHKCVYIAYAGKEIAVSDYEVLCTPPNSVCWVKTSGGVIPPNAIEGGKDPSGETMYIGRVVHENLLIPGKVHASHSCCYIPYGGKEHAFRDYEILVEQQFDENVDR